MGDEVALKGKVTVREVADGVEFSVRVQPRASRNEAAEVVGGVLKIRLTAPPVEGEANDQCIRFLADFLAVPKSRISIIRGKSSREKRIKVDGVTVDKIRRVLP